MKVAAALLPLLLAGCGLLGIGSQGQLPEAWVVPSIPIRWEADLKAGDENIPRIKDILIRMNQRIYDATDGQVRIAKFEVWSASLKPELDFGVGNLIDSTDRPHGLASPGTPKKPGYYYFRLPESFLDKSNCAGTAAHEWLHAWIGLHDEYYRASGSRTHCPDSWLERIRTDSCIMCSSERTELCRPGAHNDKTLQGEKTGMSCYEWLKKAVHDAGYGEIKLPDKYYCGPDDPPAPVIEYKFVVTP